MCLCVVPVEHVLPWWRGSTCVYMCVSISQWFCCCDKYLQYLLINVPPPPFSSPLLSSPPLPLFLTHKNYNSIESINSINSYLSVCFESPVCSVVRLVCPGASA